MGGEEKTNKFVIVLLTKNTWEIVKGNILKWNAVAKETVLKTAKFSQNPQKAEIDRGQNPS